ncbi:MAG: hypothetical protein GY845_01950, partial [Planctomycetes bacterium]|nr:hypothetical protein [Planctomycetota bacterium]
EKYTDNPMSGDLCSFESDEGVLEFDTWQYLTVSYNGSQFFVYIDGVEKDNGGGSDDCADARPSASSLFVGNGGLWGYLWVSRWYIINSSDHNDYGNAEEARFSVDNEAFWSNNNVENDDSNVPETRYINKGAVLNSRSSTFRHWEDDGSENDNIYNSSKDDTHFKETVYAFSRKNTSNHYYHSGYGGSGDVYWGQISYFFKGALQDFRVYNYNM